MLTQTIGSTVQTIKETSGALVTFKLKANASANGTRYIDLKNIVFTTATSQQYNFDDERATITVNGGSTPISQLTITANVLNLLTGTSQALMVTPSNASVTWTSSNTAVATVSNAGVVTGVAPGSATITCSSGTDTSAPFTVNVISLGDVNRDGQISIADVTALVNIILGKTNL
ncbi:MAG: Ig-like domain-containing protein [Bacteroidaceae bacterium]|nr:Ig-like domain-containing protein [Bacteroidaceae bacterium]